MPRAPFQVLVLPYRRGDDGAYEFALFRRADASLWQGIAGGGGQAGPPLCRNGSMLAHTFVRGHASPVPPGSRPIRLYKSAWCSHPAQPPAHDKPQSDQ